jgi:hypothetical protein
MATSSSASARSKAKASKAEEKAAKAAGKAEKKADKKQRRAQLWQVFKSQVKQDKRLLPYMIGTLLACAGVVTLFSWLTGMLWWAGLIFGVIIGAMVALIVFARRVQRSVYQQAEGTPGAAAWSLQNNLKGRWRVTPTVAGTTHMDAVHRVIGRPGIVLVGEGAAHRVKPLIAQEKKRIARVVGDTPIYDVIVGTGEGEVRLRKLNSHLMRLPRNISTGAVSQLDTKLASLATRSPQVGLPKGPMPSGAKMRSVQRMARRHS